MQKRYITTILIILSTLSITASAQSIASKLEIGASFGPSVPLGKFASLDTSFNAGSGWAKPGIGLNISVTYRLNKLVSLGLLIGGQRNSQDKSPQEKEINKLYVWDSNGVRTIVNKQYWKIGKIMAGGSLNIPVSASGGLYFCPGLSVGACKTSIPPYKYLVYENSTNRLLDYAWRTKIRLPWAFCYQISACLLQKITRRISVTATVNYFDAHPVYKYRYNLNFGNISSPPVYVSMRKTYALTSLNALLGVTWALK